MCSVLPCIQVPTLVLHAEGDNFPLEISRYIAEHIPGAYWVELKSIDHYTMVRAIDPVVAEIEAFLTGVRSQPESDRVLAPPLFPAIYNRTPDFKRISCMGCDFLLGNIIGGFKKWLKFKFWTC